ncbi:hypothetical protein C4J81_09610 [Deltaproteobacteria bacterium Smac51]|nr:hypothetical protein C4J81_09610 [Deltaproteobacteria bacterium Smac51]
MLTPALPASAANVGDEDALTAALAKRDPVLNITADFSLTSNKIIDYDVTLIQGNGHTLALGRKSITFNISHNLGSVVNLNLTDGSGSNAGAVYVDGELSGGISGSSFSDNSASGGGGAVYVKRKLSGGISESIFSGNSAPFHGGALYAGGGLSGGINKSFFIGNRAGTGGALFVEGGELQGGISDSIFSGNSAYDGGGALYLSDGGTIGRAAFLGNKVTDDINGGAIFFMRNLTLAPKTGETTLFTGNTVQSDKPNSIHIGTSSSADAGHLKVNPEAGGLVDMRDPFSGKTEGGGDTINITMNGPGVWKLTGESEITGAGTANFTVSQGRLHLYGGGGINLATTLASSFTLKTGATLALGGGSSTITARTIDFEREATLAFDLANNASLTLNGAGSNPFTDLTIDLMSLGKLDDSYTLVSGGDFSAYAGYTLHLRGEEIRETRAAGYFGLNGAGDLTLIQSKAAGALNTNVTWTNQSGDGLWNATSRNWSGDSVTRFLHGDDVTFNGLNLEADDLKVTVNEGGVETGSLHFSGGGWQLTGGAITANGAVAINNASVDFSGISGANDFRDGLSLNEGTLTINNEQQLGLGLGALELKNGTLNITGPTHFLTSGDHSQRLEIKSVDNVLNLDGPLAEVVISGNTNGADPSVTGGALVVEAGAGLDQTAEGGGSLTFLDNTAHDGGAVRNSGRLTLTNASFYNNTTSTESGGAMFLDSASQTTLAVTAGQTSVFLGNRDNIGANSIFLKNTVENTTTTLTIDTEAGAVLDMRDPMLSSGDSGTEIRIVKTGEGDWKLAGGNKFITVGETLIEINQGRLSLAAGTSISFPHGAGTLKIGDRARVDITGLGAELDNVKLSFDDNSSPIMGFDAAKAQSTASMLSLGYFDYNPDLLIIDLLTVPTTGGRYLLVNSAYQDIPGLADNNRLTVNGSPLIGSRAENAFSLDTTTDPKQVILVRNDSFRNESLTWDSRGGSKNWDLTTENWMGDSKKFFHGDDVTFSNTGENTVNLTGQMRVADMEVRDKHYTFQGDGSIWATADGTTISDAQGSLLITAGGTADFSLLTGDNKFEGGVVLQNFGQVVISRAGQLGVSLDRLKFGPGDGTLAVKAASGSDGIVAFTDAGLSLSFDNPGHQGTIDVQEGATLRTSRPLTFSEMGELSKTGYGTWQLGGDSQFSPASSKAIRFQVSGGTLHLLGPGQEGADPARLMSTVSDDFTFLVSATGTLRVGGANAVTAKKIEFRSTDSKMSFTETALAHERAALTLTAADNGGYVGFLRGTNLGFTVVDLPDSLPLSWGQSYVLIDTGTGHTPFATLTASPHSFDVAQRLKTELKAGSAGKELILEAGDDDNRILTWTGNEDTDWSTSSQINWTALDGPNPVETFFLKGDAVVFDSASGGTVNLSEAVTAAGMEIKSGSYKFTGRGLTLSGQPADTNLAGATGKLAVSGGKADFTSLTEANRFEGVDLSGGELAIATVDQLGLSSLADLTWSGGTLTAAGNNLVFNTGPLTGTGTGTKTLNVLTGTEVTISGGLGGSGTLAKAGAGNLTIGAGTAPGLNLKVDEGQLILAGNQNLASFTLANGAALGGLNAARNISTSGNLTLAAGSRLSYDLRSLNPGDTVLSLNVGGNLALAVNKALNFKLDILNTPSLNTAFTLIDAGAGKPVFSGVDLTAADIIDTPGLNNMYAELSTDPGGQKLYYTYRSLTNNDNPMIWQGTAGDNLWKSSTGEPYLWKDSVTGVLSHFYNADQVIFNGTDTATEVTVENAGVLVSQMDITAGNYTFSGGSITGLTVTGGPGNGQLTIRSGSAAHFENDLSFAGGGIQVDGGAAMTFAGSSLKGDLSLSGDFTFEPGKDVTYDGTITGGGQLLKTNTGTLTLTGDGSGFTGSTTIAAGGLMLDKISLGGDVTVADAAIGGSGQLGGDLALTNSTVTVNPLSDLLDVAGTITASGSQILNLTGWGNGTYTILLARAGLNTNPDDWTLIYNGGSLNHRQGGQILKDGNELKAELSVANTTLNWTGTGSVWNGSASAWTTPANQAETFIDGDAVAFGASAANKNIYVDGSRKVASMSVTGGDYVFRGGSIIGDALGSSLVGHSGQLTISGGSAQFQGKSSFAGGATVKSGGKLALSGPSAEMAADVAVESGGLYSLGLGGTLNGNLKMLSGSLLSVAGAATQTVTGTADLSSGLKARLDYMTWMTGEKVTLLTAADLVGTFKEQALSTAAFSGRLVVDGDKLNLEVLEGPGDNPGSVVGGSSNQQSTINAVGSMADGHPLKNILLLATKEEARRAADLLSGEGQDGTASALMGRQRGFGSGLGQRISKKFKGNYRTAPASGDGETGGSLWAEIGAGESKIKGGSGTAEAKISGPQIALGMEGQTGEGWLGGLSLTYADLESKVDGRNYKSDIDALGLNFWGGRDFRIGSGRLRALAGLGLTRYEMESKRKVAFGGFYDRLKADHTARGLDIFGEISYNFQTGEWLSLEPFANLAYNRLHFKGYSENGGPAALKYEAETQSGFSGVLGLRGLAEASEEVEIGLSLGWRHNFGDLDWSSGRAFRDGSDSFLVKGAGADRNALETGLDLNLGLTERVGLILSYDGLYGSNEQSHGGSARLTWEW